MIAETHPARVHHPIIGVTQTPLPKPVGLFPGCGHIAEYHVHHSAVGADLFAIPRSVPLVLRHDSRPLLQLEIAPDFFGDDALLRRILVRRASVARSCPRLLRSTPACVAQEDFYLLLHGRRQEIALDGRDALGWLRRDNVDTDHTTIGARPVKRNLSRAALGQ